MLYFLLIIYLKVPDFLVGKLGEKLTEKAPHFL